MELTTLTPGVLGILILFHMEYVKHNAPQVSSPEMKTTFVYPTVETTINLCYGVILSQKHAKQLHSIVPMVIMQTILQVCVLSLSTVQ